MVSAIEIQKRIPVWIALSNFYLDTELEDTDLLYIIEVFKQSPFSFDEIRQIDYFEVAPVLSSNLMSVAGVWDAFDEAWLIESITPYLKRKRRSNFISKIVYKYWGSSYWKRIEKLNLGSLPKKKQTNGNRFQ